MKNTTNNSSSLITMCVLALIIIFVAGVILYTSIHTPSDSQVSVAPTPTVPTGELCKTNPQKYTTNDALQNAGQVCYLQIQTMNDLDQLAKMQSALTNLQVLNVQDITSKQVNTSIGSFPYLRELRLDGIEGQTELPPEIGNLSGLVTLKIDSTELEKIPPEIANLQNLTTLYISLNDDLETIPYSVAKLTKLENVTVRYNPDAKIPDSLVTQKHLKSLVINAQNQMIIPNGVYDLRSLTVLDYSSNSIATISAELNNLTSLQYLLLNYNHIKQLPPIKNLQHLQQLEMKSNQLTSLPLGFITLQKVQSINLSDNLLDDSSMDVFQSLPLLVSLDLGDNKLTKVPPGLDHLKKLQYLRLTGNTIDKQSITDLQKMLPNTNIVF